MVMATVQRLVHQDQALYYECENCSGERFGFQRSETSVGKLEDFGREGEEEVLGEPGLEEEVFDGVILGGVHGASVAWAVAVGERILASHGEGFGLVWGYEKRDFNCER